MATQVEIVNPKLEWHETLGLVFSALIGLAVRVLIIWWAIASWAPELGLTYWQLFLPVVALRELILPGSIRRTAK
jgi:hypothetical protein